MTVQSFQYKIPCCLHRLGKKEKLNKFRKKKLAMFTLPNMVFLLFLPRMEYKIFQIINLHDRSVYSQLHPAFFFDFFKAINLNFLDVKKEL
jgi:hypothetical protein